MSREELGGRVSQTPGKTSAQGEIHRSAGLQTCSPHEVFCPQQNTEPAPIRIPQKKKDAVDEVCPLPPPHKEFVDPLGIKANRVGGGTKTSNDVTPPPPRMTQVSGRFAR